jgi:peptidoglycan hydrolase-like protein with peptidoglycan-binding domain
MLKHYLTGLILTVLLITAIIIPVTAEQSLDTGIDEAYYYPVLQLNDNSNDVVNLQSRLRDLGYYNYKVTGNFGTLTEYAVKLFQKYNGIEQLGYVDQATSIKLYGNDAIRMPMSAIDASADRFGVTPSPTPKATAKPTKKPQTSSSSSNNANISSNGSVKTGSYMDWSEVKNIFKKGTKATVYDFNTGVSWTVKRTGGSKHADVEPVSATDTALYKKALGKYFKNWKRQPCVVVVGGYRIAGSYHGYPHGYDAISGNNLTGHYCIHFKNSRTHCSNKIDSDHQACVRKAAGV